MSKSSFEGRMRVSRPRGVWSTRLELTEDTGSVHATIRGIDPVIVALIAALAVFIAADLALYLLDETERPGRTDVMWVTLCLVEIVLILLAGLFGATEIHADPLGLVRIRRFFGMRAVRRWHSVNIAEVRLRPMFPNHADLTLAVMQRLVIDVCYERRRIGLSYANLSAQDAFLLAESLSRAIGCQFSFIEKVSLRTEILDLCKRGKERGLSGDTTEQSGQAACEKA